MFGSPMTLVKVSPPDWKGWEGAAWQLGTKIPNFGLHVVLSTINHPKTSPNSMAEGFLGLDGSDLRFHQVKPGSISIHFPHWAAPTTHPCFLCHGRMPCSKQTCWGFADLTSIPGYIVNDTSTPAQPILTSPGLDISRTNLSRINISGSSSCHHQWPGFHLEKPKQRPKAVISHRQPRQGDVHISMLDSAAILSSEN